jgi:subtilisin family serine protease
MNNVSLFHSIPWKRILVAAYILGFTTLWSVFAQAQVSQFPHKKTAAPITQRVLTEGYTLTVPGKLQSDGSYSLAKTVSIARPAKGTYLKNTIVLKLRNAPLLSKESTRTNAGSNAGSNTNLSASLRSPSISTILEAYPIASIRAAHSEFNSGKRIAQDKYGLGRVVEVRLVGNPDIISICRDLNNNPDVEYAEPVFINALHQDRTIPNDPMFAMQFALERIQASRAWSVVKGDSTILLAVVDSGVDWEHEDLAENIWTNPGESGRDAQGRDKRSNGVDDDGNGKIDDWHGWDFTGAVTDEALDLGIFREDNDPKPRRQTFNEEDVNLHGTHVAGLAAAVTNNGKGVAGAAYSCRILPVKCGTDRTDPGGAVYRGYEGILYAALMGAHIINNSWGGTGAFSLYNQDIVNTATALGSLVVSSAGNNNELMDNIGFPASYDNVLTVGNSTVNDLPLSTLNGNFSGSSFGIKTEVWAPGANVQSIYLNDNKYGPLTGTSMSSPVVAGIAALVRKQHPDWSPQQITQQIRITSDNVFNVGATAVRGNPNDRPPFYFGRLNAFRAVTYNRVLNEGAEQLPGVITAGVSISGAEGAISSYQVHRFVLRVQNVLSNARNLTVTLTSLDGRATALEATRSVGNLNTMEQKAVLFDLQLNPSSVFGNGSTDFLVTYRASSTTGEEIVNYDRITVTYRLTAVRQPLLVISPVLHYGVVNPFLPATQTVSIRNLGNQDVWLRTPVFTGANASSFSLVNAFDSTLVEAGTSRAIPIRFTPSPMLGTTTTAGERTANLTFSATSVGVIAGGGTSFTGDYGFESVRGQYEEFTDGTRLAGGAEIDDDDFTTAIGFPFRFGNATLERVTVSSNGYIVFAPSNPISGQGTTVQAPFFARGINNATGWISAFASDLQCRTDGDIRVKVSGTAPNRVFTVQWRRMSFWEEGANFAQDANLNFQIRLYEGTNRVEQVYGPMSFTGAQRGANAYMGIGQVGILGASDADFQTRRVRVNLGGTTTNITRTVINNTWETSAEGGLTSFAEISPTTAPPQGLTYRWNFQPVTPVVTGLQRTTVLRAEISGRAVASTPTSAFTPFAPTTTGSFTTQTITIRNIGSVALIPTRMSLVTTPTVPLGTFTILDSIQTIAAGDSARVSIRFAPSTNGTFAAGFRLESNGDPLQIPMLGLGTIPPAARRRVLVYGFTGGADFPSSNILSRFDRFPQNIQGTITPVTIGTVRVARDIEIRSRGTEAITVTGVTITGNASAEFVISEPQFPITLQPGQVRALRVEYRPIVAGEKSVDVQFEGNMEERGFLSFSSIGAIPRFVSVNPRTAAQIFPETGPDVRDRFPLAVPTTEIGETGSFIVRLQNSTAASTAARITGVRIRGVASEDYIIDSTFLRRLPLQLAPGEASTFRITFRPTMPGDRLASLVVAADGMPSEEDVSLSGIGLERRFFVNRIARVFTTEVGTTSASQLISVFGDARQTVNIIGTPRIEGKDSLDFVMTLPMPFVRRLPFDSVARFSIVFTPKTPGPKQARFALQSDVGPIFVNLIGTAITVSSATLRTTSISAPPGAMVNVPILLTERRNIPIGTQIFADIRVNASLLTPLASTPSGVVIDGQRIISLTLTFTGDSVLATLPFTAQLGSEISSALQLTAVAINETSALRLTTVSGRFTLTNVPSAAFSQLAYEQFQDRDITIPITFTNRQNIPATAPMTTALEYNGSLLDILTNNPSGVANAVRTYNPTTRLTTLTFRIPQSTQGGMQDTTISLNFKAAIGNAPNTALRLTSTFASGLRVEGAPATFTLRGLNQAGGTRLYYSNRTALAILASSPNPAKDVANITFALSQVDDKTASQVILTVSDVYGKTLATERLGDLFAGEHLVSIPLSQYPSGTYFFTLSSGAAKATTKVQTLK